MSKNTFLLLFLLVGFNAAQAQNNGQEQLGKLCGCFSVNFKYAETFAPDPQYKFHDREEMNATELALPIEKTDNKLVIQHLLVINDTMIIKHWREEWEYEAKEMYEYAGNRVWNRKEVPAAESKGKWMQTVWEVSDEPRYQGMSAWVNTDGKTFWENTADAPLPRREYSVRSDYNVMKRRNRIVITNDGYLHEQDNDKIIRDGKNDKLLAQEKGYNTYIRMEDSECKAATDWWKKNEQFWSVVRTEWNTYLAKNATVSLKNTVDDKMMNEHFFALWKEWKNKKIKPTELDAKVKEVMTKFL